MSYHVFLIPCHVSPLKSPYRIYYGWLIIIFDIKHSYHQGRLDFKFVMLDTPCFVYDVLCGVFHKVGLRDKTEIIPTECFFYRMINTLCTECCFLFIFYQHITFYVDTQYSIITIWYHRAIYFTYHPSAIQLWL